MQHVRQGLRMHQAMLDGDVQKHARRFMAGPGSEIRSRELSVKSLANPAPVTFDLLPGRPIRGLIRRPAAVHRIDTECKKTIELRIERFCVWKTRMQKV